MHTKIFQFFLHDSDTPTWTQSDTPRMVTALKLPLPLFTTGQFCHARGPSNRKTYSGIYDNYMYYNYRVKNT